MTDQSADTSLVDSEIRVFAREKRGYSDELTLRGQQEFPYGYMAAEITPWVPGGLAEGRA